MDWHALLGSEDFTEWLKSYVISQRWYGEKSKGLLEFKISEALLFPDKQVVLLILSCLQSDTSSQKYHLALSYTTSGQSAKKSKKKDKEIPEWFCFKHDAAYYIRDALLSEAFREYLRTLLYTSASVALTSLLNPKEKIRLKSIEGDVKSILGADASTVSGVLTLEQSNSALYFGKKGTKSSLFVKFYRKSVAGINPDAEMSFYLSQAGFRNSGRFAGEVILHPAKREPIPLLMALGYTPNEGDGWSYFKEQAQSFISRVKKVAPEEITLPSSLLESWRPKSKLLSAIGPKPMLLAGKLGRRTGEMHVTLSRAKTAQLKPKRWKKDDLTTAFSTPEKNAKETFSALKTSPLPERFWAIRDVLLSHRAKLKPLFQHAVSSVESATVMAIRVHGDYHLGQVLFTGNDFVIIDFEGEPARSLSERRAVYPVFKDIAGMIRSFHYAAYAGIYQHPKLKPEEIEAVEPFAEVWFNALSGEFLKAYRKQLADAALLPEDKASFEALLKAYMCDKAIYELNYEMNNRPNWVGIPLKGIQRLLDQ